MPIVTQAEVARPSATDGEGSGRPVNGALPLVVLVGACVVGSVLLWAPILGTWFVGDDLVEVGEAVAAPPAGRLGGDDLRLFRPLFHLGLCADHALWGTSSFGYHLTSAVLHGLVAAAVGLLGRRLWSQLGPAGGSRTSDVGGWTVAVLAAAVFLVHPSHTEAVAWISARSDLIAAFFATLSLLAWTHTSPARAGGRQDARGGGWVPVVAAAVALAAALASKESAVSLPAVAAVLEAFRAAPGRRLRSALTTWPLWATLGAYAVVRLFVSGAIEGYGTAGVQLARLVGRALAVPARSVLPALPAAAWVAVGLVVLGAVVVGASGFAARWSTEAEAARRSEGAPGGRRGHGCGPLLGFLAVATVVAAAPVLLLGVSLTSLSGERVVYLPSVFGSILVAVLLDVLMARRRSAGITACVVVLAAGAALTVANELRWRDSADAARAVVEPFVDLRPGAPAYLLNQPGAIRGVVAARNSLPFALDVLVRGRRPEVVVAATQDLPHPDQHVEVALGPAAGGTSVVLTAPGSSFGADGTVVKPDGGPAIRVVRAEGGVLEVHVPASVDLRDVWYVDRGRPRRLG